MEATQLTTELFELFQRIESSFKSTQLGLNRWYLLVIGTVSGSPDPTVAAALYTYLIRQDSYQTSESRKLLVRRLREALIMTFPIAGACKPLEAVLAIAELERPEDRDYSTTRTGWQADGSNHERGVRWFERLYARNASETLQLFDAHKDISWISIDITYGFYLSDRQVFDDIDTQIVVLPAIMSQNMALGARWHLRGTRRIGVSKKDVQVIWDAVMEISRYLGMKLDKLPTVEDVEPDV
ncbi:unnamed protein product [Fusarium fujikuroi]|uniref:Uncharacterized protein n=1 Tax=Fusarium fujikuroi TaxID=5127 RepID=A0A9Q9RT78_FUSFU|nr:uncharacterized protein FFE2_15962 [Fusarium fujikuroi]SCO54072.1 uncharacterized protein FFNC_15323 [Fusarium fujikuroi]VTT78170.1 unnamed protein product [Fusarium fujikuroi]VZI11124.1 unnamed protein product [Fusarium fujikuroi]